MGTRRPAPRFDWFIPIDGDGVRLGTRQAERPPTFDYLREVVQAAERLGFSSLLIPTRFVNGLFDEGAPLAETWTMATALAAVTSRIRFLIAIRPGFIAAGLLAQMVATLDQISRGRVDLNIVPGGIPGDFERLGVALDHAGRYAQAEELMQACRALWTGALTDFHGTSITLRGRRSQVVLATKVASNIGAGPNMHGASRKHIVEQIDRSLQSLQTEDLDLYQIHDDDPFTPLEETRRTRDHLVQQGKVRYIGCSNFAAWQVAEAMGTARALGLEPLVSVEPEYRMLKRGIARELLPCCTRDQVGVLPYFPLASGFLTGTYRRGQPPGTGTRFAVQTHRAATILTPQNFDVLDQLAAFAAARCRPLVELAFAWSLAHPQVSRVIAGATAPAQITANAKAVDWHLSAAEMAELDGILQALAPTWDTPTAHLRPFQPW
jgi:aryl-alcohol dehydrogenase-like predicted oxidoreductase